MAYRKAIETKQSPNRRLISSVLLTYALVLLVGLSLLMIGYLCSVCQAQEHMEDLQTSLLEQIRQEVDLRFSSVTKVSNLFASNALTMTISGRDDEKVEYQYDYRELLQLIVEQNNLMAGEGETSVYFLSSDSVIAEPSRYRSVNLDAYTSQLGMTPEEFRDFMLSGKTRGEFRVLHPNTDTAELVYLEPVLDHALQRIGVVMVRISMAKIQQTMNASRWTQGSIFHIRYRDEMLRIEGAKSRSKVSLDDISLGEEFKLDGLPTVTEIDEAEYVTIGLPSAVNTWDYYFSIPKKTFYRPTKVYMILFLIFLAFSMVTGLAMAFFFSKRFSRPVQQIMDSLQLNSTVAYPQAMASLEKALASYRRDLISAKKQLDRGSQKEIDSFLYAMCRGSLPSRKVMENLEKYEIPLSNTPVSLVLFQYGHVERSIFYQDGFLDSDMLYYASRNVIEELLCGNGGTTLLHNGKAICLYQPRIGYQNDLREALEQIYHFHREYLSVNLQIFCAGPCQVLNDLPELLSDVEEMAQYKLFWSGDIPDILFYEEAVDFGISQPVYDSVGDAKRFMNLWAIKDYAGAYKVLMQQLDTGFSKNLKNFRQERFKVYGFVSDLLELLMASGQKNEEDMAKVREAADSLLSSNSVADVRERANQLFQQLIARQELENSSDYPGWVKEVRGYIESNYADPQLDVAYLAEVFQLNVSYLSRTYKKATSIGVLDNIHMVRIVKAKELLAQGVNVQETAARVGYLESRALIRTFKRYESMTPGQYQESLLNLE